MLVLGTLAMLLVSCGTSAPRYNYKGTGACLHPSEYGY